MRVIKIILIILLFASLIVGAIMVIGARGFAEVGHKNQDNSRRVLKIKLIGYILFMATFALAIFQSMIAW